MIMQFVHRQPGYEKALIEKSETELQNSILAAQNYNEELKKRQNVMIYPPQEQSLNHEAYEAVLCMNAEGLMGFIEIPQIHIYLPIYHGHQSMFCNWEPGIWKVLHFQLAVLVRKQ